MLKTVTRAAVAALVFVVVVAIVAGAVLMVVDYLRLRAQADAAFEYLTAPVVAPLTPAERERLASWRKGKPLPRADVLDLLSRETAAAAAP